MLKKLKSKISLLSVMAILTLSGTGCGTSMSQPVITETFTFTPDSHLDAEGSTKDGDNYVFEYVRYEDPNPMMSDDESTYQVLFEISKNDINNFSFKDEDLVKINTLSVSSCFYCLPESSRHVVNKITTGSIEGKKNTDGSWKIVAKLNEIYSDMVNQKKYEYNFSSDFQLKPKRKP